MKLDKIRARRIAVEAFGFVWIALMMIGVGHASQYHPVNFFLLAIYLVAAFVALCLYVYLAYVLLL